MDPTVPGSVKSLYPKRTRDRLARLAEKLHLTEQEVVDQATLMLEWGGQMSSDGRHVGAFARNQHDRPHYFMLASLENLRDTATTTQPDVPAALRPVTHIRSLRVVRNNQPTKET